MTEQDNTYPINEGKKSDCPVNLSNNPVYQNLSVTPNNHMLGYITFVNSLHDKNIVKKLSMQSQLIGIMWQLTLVIQGHTFSWPLTYRVKCFYPFYPFIWAITFYSAQSYGPQYFSALIQGHLFLELIQVMQGYSFFYA